MENAENKTPETKVEEPLKPPYGNVTWYEDFSKKIHSGRDFDRLDKEWIKINIVKGPNATMVFNGLRFLGLVEEDGKVTEKLKSLRSFGDEFKQNLGKVVKEAYSLLFSNVALESAKPETLLSFFAKYYGYVNQRGMLQQKFSSISVGKQRFLYLRNYKRQNSRLKDLGKRGKRRNPEKENTKESKVFLESPKGCTKSNGAIPY
jgi:hypothetical protein